MSNQVGQVFSTGNTVVRGLQVGSVLEVVGQGQLKVVEVPFVPLQAGDRIKSKYGFGTVVRVTSTRGADGVIEDLLDEGDVVYVADGTSVVRIAPDGEYS